MIWKDRYDKSKSFIDKLREKFISVTKNDLDMVTISIELGNETYFENITGEIISLADEKKLLEIIHKKLSGEIERDIIGKFLHNVGPDNNIVVTPCVPQGTQITVMHPSDYAQWLRTRNDLQ